MIGLVLSPVEVTLLRLLIVAVMVLAFAVLALVSALGAGFRSHQQPPRRRPQERDVASRGRWS